VRGSGATVYATVLGGSTRSVRNGELSSLLAWGLAQFRRVDAIDSVTSYASVELPYGRAPLALVAERPLRLVARIGRPLTERIVAPTAVTLPVTDGEPLGTIEIWRDGHLAGSRPLVASRSVSRPGAAGRLRWYATRTLHHLRNIFP
jgi:D-alanyl-D-alanine carboxypeptidase